MERTGTIRPEGTYIKETFSDLIQDQEEISKCEFIECKFTDCSFMGSVISSSVFEKCKFENVNLSNAKFPSSSLQSCCFSSCKMLGIDFTLFNTKLGLRLTCSSCDLSYSFLTEIDLSESIFTKCKFEVTDMSRSKMKKSKFKECEMLKAIFLDTDLSGAEFISCNNLLFNPSQNMCKGAKIGRQNTEDLLLPFGIIVEDN